MSASKKRNRGRKAIDAALAITTPFLPAPIQAALSVMARELGFDAANVVEESIADFREQLREEHIAWLKAGFDGEYLNTRSLAQLYVLVAHAVVTERLSEKRAVYARILCRANTPDWSDRAGRIDEALRALMQIGEADLRVLRVVMQLVQALGIREDSYSEPDFRLDDIRKALPDLSPGGVRTYLTRLGRLGLILEIPTAGGIEGGAFLGTHLLQELIALTEPWPTRVEDED